MTQTLEHDPFKAEIPPTYGEQLDEFLTAAEAHDIHGQAIHDDDVNFLIDTAQRVTAHQEEVSKGFTIPGTDEWIPGKTVTTYNLEYEQEGTIYSEPIAESFAQRLMKYAAAHAPQPQVEATPANGTQTSEDDSDLPKPGELGAEANRLYNLLMAATKTPSPEPQTQSGNASRPKPGPGTTTPPNPSASGSTSRPKPGPGNQTNRPKPGTGGNANTAPTTPNQRVVEPVVAAKTSRWRRKNKAPKYEWTTRSAAEMAQLVGPKSAADKRALLAEELTDIGIKPTDENIIEFLRTGTVAKAVEQDTAQPRRARAARKLGSLSIRASFGKKVAEAYETALDVGYYFADMTLYGADRIKQRVREAATYVSERAVPLTEKLKSGKKGARYIGRVAMSGLLDLNPNRVANMQQSLNEQTTRNEQNVYNRLKLKQARRSYRKPL